MGGGTVVVVVVVVGGSEVVVASVVVGSGVVVGVGVVVVVVVVVSLRVMVFRNCTIAFVVSVPPNIALMTLAGIQCPGIMASTGFAINTSGSSREDDIEIWDVSPHVKTVIALMITLGNTGTKEKFYCKL